MTDFPSLIKALREARVDFIVVGGVAATVHGSARVTYDLDIVYSRKRDNLSRVVSALAPNQPYPRGAPPGLPFIWDERTLANGLNFTLTTSLGSIDLLGEIVGGGLYEDLLPHSIPRNLFGYECSCLDLEWLIRVKRAAGRPKDFEAIAELEEILRERKEAE